MSNDGQDSGWAEFGARSKRSQPSIVKTPLVPLECSVDTIDQLLKWASSIDGQCPNVMGFNCKQAALAISLRLDSRPQRYGALLPQLFWGSLKRSLEKAENLWGFVMSGSMGWTVSRLREDPHMAESVTATANELHKVFSQWYEFYADGLNGTGDAVWEKVLHELALKGETLSLIRVEYQGDELPFFQWSADYHVPSWDEPLSVPSSDIAAWFVLFSLTRVFEQFVFLLDCLIPDTGQEVDKDHSNELFQYGIDIQDALTVAEYWYDRLYSLDETLKEFEKRVCSDAQSMTREQLKKTDAPRLSVGRVNLFEWFKNSSSREAGYSQWQSFWMAKTGQLEPPNDTEWNHEEVQLAIADLRDSFQTAVMKLAFDKAVAEFRNKHLYEKNLLLILDGKHTKPTDTAVKELVVMLIGNADGSANTIFFRAFSEVSAYREKLNSDRKEYSKMLRENKVKVRKNLIAGKTIK